VEGDERAPEEHPEHEGFVAEQRAHRLEKPSDARGE
jgi:hypothetical protein